MRHEAMEFPSDNPDLWVAHTPRPSLARSDERAPVETHVVAPDSPAEMETEVEVAEFDESDFTSIEIESIPPPAADAFEVYVRALMDVALGANVSRRIVELIPAMLGLARLDVLALDASAIDALVATNLLARTEAGTVTRSASFVAAAKGWRAALLQEEADMSACTTMLDEWSANLIAELAGVPSQRDTFRRSLRARGIAAFGMAA